MRKNALIKIVVIISVLVISMFSGCIQSTVNEQEFDVFFDSDVVNLVNYSFNLEKTKQGKIYSAEVIGRVENKLNRVIDIKITAEFHDKDNNILTEKEYTIIGLRPKPNPGHSTTFDILYDEDENVNIVDNVRLYANEIE